MHIHTHMILTPTSSTSNPASVSIISGTGTEATANTSRSGADITARVRLKHSYAFRFVVGFSLRKIFVKTHSRRTNRDKRPPCQMTKKKQEDSETPPILKRMEVRRSALGCSQYGERGRKQTLRSFSFILLFSFSYSSLLSIVYIIKVWYTLLLGTSLYTCAVSFHAAAVECTTA